MHYRDADGMVSERVVQPIRVYSSGLALYLDCFCELRAGERRFRVDRIVALASAETGEVIDDPDAIFRPFARAVRRLPRRKNGIW